MISSVMKCSRRCGRAAGEKRRPRRSSESVARPYGGECGRWGSTEPSPEGPTHAWFAEGSGGSLSPVGAVGPCDSRGRSTGSRPPSTTGVRKILTRSSRPWRSQSAQGRLIAGAEIGWISASPRRFAEIHTAQDVKHEPFASERGRRCPCEGPPPWVTASVRCADHGDADERFSHSRQTAREIFVGTRK